MKTGLWIVLLVAVAWTSFLIGYGVSALTGVKRPTVEVTATGGGYGAAAGGSGAAAGGYGAPAGGSEATPGGSDSGEGTAD